MTRVLSSAAAAELSIIAAIQESDRQVVKQARQAGREPVDEVADQPGGRWYRSFPLLPGSVEYSPCTDGLMQ